MEIWEVEDGPKCPSTLGRHFAGEFCGEVLGRGMLRVPKLEDRLCCFECRLELVPISEARGKNDVRVGVLLRGAVDGEGGRGELERNERCKLRKEDGVWRNLEDR